MNGTKKAPKKIETENYTENVPSKVVNYVPVQNVDREGFINYRPVTTDRKKGTITIAFYLTLKYKENEGIALSDYNARASLTALELVRSKVSNPFKASKNPTGRIPRSTSDFRLRERLGGNFRSSSEFAEGRIPKDILEEIERIEKENKVGIA